MTPGGDVDEDTWRAGVAPHRERWEARAREPGLTESQRFYALHRAARLAGRYASRTEACSVAGTDLRCAGPRGVACRPLAHGRKRERRMFGCRQHLVCVRCRAARAKAGLARVRNALLSAYEHARMHDPTVLLVMATISLAHTGDVARDRRELSESWGRFRRACTHRWGSFPFVGVFEVTPGRDLLGHVHAHVVCLWPRGKPGDGTQGDWEELQRMWVDSARVGNVERSSRINFRASSSCKKAAGYVSKYMSKGVTTRGFDPVLAAKVVAGTYNTRWLFSSRRFWLPWAPTCKVCGCRVESATFNFSRVPPLPPGRFVFDVFGVLIDPPIVDEPTRQHRFAFADDASTHERASARGA